MIFNIYHIIFCKEHLCKGIIFNFTSMTHTKQLTTLSSNSVVTLDWHWQATPIHSPPMFLATETF